MKQGIASLLTEYGRLEIVGWTEKEDEPIVYAQLDRADAPTVWHFDVPSACRFSLDANELRAIADLADAVDGGLTIGGGE